MTVTGTAFSLSWTPEEERFDLRLENGAVAVSGPSSDQPIALPRGQWLTIHLRPREVLIRESRGSATALRRPRAGPRGVPPVPLAVGAGARIGRPPIPSPRIRAEASRSADRPAPPPNLPP